MSHFVWIKLVPLLRSADLSADHRLGHVVGLHEISIISELMILTRWFKNDLLADEKNDQKNHKKDNLSDIYRFLKLIKSIILTKKYILNSVQTLRVQKNKTLQSYSIPFVIKK